MKNSELKEFIYDIIEREYPLESFNTKENKRSFIEKEACKKYMPFSN